MLKLFLGEFREVFWLASAVTGLSMLGVGLGIAMAAWAEHLPAIASRI